MATAEKFVNDSSNQDSVRINGADAVERIRGWLIDSGYAESATRASTNDTPDDQAAANSAAELPAVRLLLGGSPLAVAEAEKLFTPEDLQAWIDAGLLAKAEERVLPLVRITPYRKLFVVSDREWTEEALPRPDVVSGLTSSSRWMADFTIRRESHCTLDLGTGTGVQAMLAARHSTQVVATDINPRALEFARFNAALNGIDNIEFIEGDRFEAVQRVLPLVRITPYRKLFVVSDREWTEEALPRPDVVSGLTSSSRWMADFTIRRESHCTLDLGTGTGVQAMLAARHSTQVVATDINPRALEFARFNAALNGIDNIEFIEGDRFEAVEGRTFDLILSNMALSVSPASGCLDGDDPMDGDESLRQFIQTAPSYLNKGGYAQTVCNWVQLNDESWTSRLSDRLTRAGYDASVVRRQSSSPADYARSCLNGYDTSNVEQLFGDWISDCEKQGIESIDGGLITMRRSGRQPNWLRIDAKVPEIFPDAGAHVARCFWLQDFLSRVPDLELLNEVLYLSPSVELTQTSKPTIAGWQLLSCELTMTRGIAMLLRIKSNVLPSTAANMSPSINSMLSMPFSAALKRANSNAQGLISVATTCLLCLAASMACTPVPVPRSRVQSEPQRIVKSAIRRELLIRPKTTSGRGHASAVHAGSETMNNFLYGVI